MTSPATDHEGRAPSSAGAQPRRGRLVVVSGPSGSGKTTICERLLQDPRFRRAVTATTRPPRAGEVAGRDYVFLDRAEFERRRDRGAFLEWAEVYGNLYGTLHAEIDPHLADGHFVLLNIDTQGAATLRARGVDASFVFLTPPDLATLEARLRARGTDSEEVLRRRLARAEAEMAEAPRYDHRVENDDAERAAEEVGRLVAEDAARGGRDATEGAADGDAP